MPCCGVPNQALATVLEATRNLEIVTAVGMPVRVNNKLYNCAVIIQKGSILGIVPKTHLPNYGEFYEKRQFAPAPAEDDYISFCGQEARYPSAPGRFLRVRICPELVLGFEICEDLWAPGISVRCHGPCRGHGDLQPLGQ